MLKNFFSLFLCGIMLLSLVACGKNSVTNTPLSDNSNSNKITSETNESKKVFDTENIARITFYSYYGAGQGSEVPTEQLEEIKKWLGSFTIGEKAPDILPPGTNTYYVEIEYADGTIIKTGLDAIAIDGVTYYITSDKEPECFKEIILKTSL